MKKIIIVIVVIFTLLIPLQAYSLTKEQLQAQTNRINPSIMKYVNEINIKDKASYSIPNMVILADANSLGVINIYQATTEEQLYDVLLHEAGHCVYWKTNQTYSDMEKWADYFRIVAKWGMTVDEIVRYVNWVLNL